MFQNQQYDQVPHKYFKTTIMISLLKNVSQPPFKTFSNTHQKTWENQG